MPERTFHDSQDTEWLVYDCKPAAGLERGFAPEMQTGWLCFQSEAEKRRLVNYPAEWNHYSSRQLEMLLREAVVASWVSPAAGTPKYVEPPAEEANKDGKER